MNMMRQFKLLWAALVALLSTQTALAHTMWLETAPQAQLGKKHQVALYFGEFSMADRTPTKGWLTGMHLGKWEVLTPQGETLTLEAVQTDSCYMASFTPKQKGWYRVHYDCVVPQLWRGSQLHYQSIAWVYVGDRGATISEAQRKSPFGQGFTPLPSVEPMPQVGQASHFPIAVDSGEHKGLKLTIQGDNGWAKNYYRYPEGQLAFTPIWAGRYLMSATKQSTLTEEESKMHNGAKGIYDMITYFISF